YSLFYITKLYVLFYLSDSNDDSPDETQSTSDHEYLPSSSEASDDTFTKIKKNVYTFDCLWVIDDYDISKLLMEYRACAIKNSTSENIDISEILSINHIFLLEQNDNAGIQMFFDSDKWKKMFVQIVSELPAYEISIDGLECCHVVGRVASSNVNECESLIRKLRKKYGNSEDIILDVLYSVTKILENKTRSRKEDTFVHDNIEPMLNNFFQNGKLYRCEWSTTVLEESAHHKKKFDPTFIENKPDFLVYNMFKESNHILLVMEVKPLVKPNTNPLFNDLRKPGNEMKDIIDKCIEDGIYDDRMIYLGKFFAPCICYDLSVTSSAIELLSTIKVGKFEVTKQSKDNKMKSMIRNSYHTPIKYAVKKEMEIKRTLLSKLKNLKLVAEMHDYINTEQNF
ncbi:18662_t:CDS:2, partial [Entrophospora sp. SA101]